MKAKPVVAMFGVVLMIVMALIGVGGASAHAQAGDWYSRGIIRRQTINVMSVRSRKRAYRARQKKEIRRRRKQAIHRHG